jgi:hypothetical protein
MKIKNWEARTKRFNNYNSSKRKETLKSKKEKLN